MDALTRALHLPNSKHAIFDCILTIHDLSNVPLVVGDYRIKWKFEHSYLSSSSAIPAHLQHHLHQSAPGKELTKRQHKPEDHSQAQTDDPPASEEKRDGPQSAFLHPLSALRSSQNSQHSPLANGKVITIDKAYEERPRGRQRSDSDPSASAGSNASHSRARTVRMDHSLAREDSNTTVQSPSEGHPTAAKSESKPKPPMLMVSTTTTRTSDKTQVEQSNVDTSPSTSALIGLRDATGKELHDKPDSPPRWKVDPDTIKLSSAVAEPKGTTSLRPLKNHSVSFDKKIRCPVSMPVSSKTSELQPCLLKLSIKQKMHTDSSRLEENKVGELRIDLANFVETTLAGLSGGMKRSASNIGRMASHASLRSLRDQQRAVSNGHTGQRMEVGKTTSKRFLLRKSKTNALLKVSLELVFIAGERSFQPPGSVQHRETAEARSRAASFTPSARNRSSASIRSGHSGHHSPNKARSFTTPKKAGSKSSSSGKRTSPASSGVSTPATSPVKSNHSDGHGNRLRLPGQHTQPSPTARDLRLGLTPHSTRRRNALNVIDNLLNHKLDKLDTSSRSSMDSPVSVDLVPTGVNRPQAPMPQRTPSQQSNMSHMDKARMAIGLKPKASSSQLSVSNISVKSSASKTSHKVSKDSSRATNASKTDRGQSLGRGSLMKRAVSDMAASSTSRCSTRPLTTETVTKTPKWQQLRIPSRPEPIAGSSADLLRADELSSRLSQLSVQPAPTKPPVRQFRPRPKPTQAYLDKASKSSAHIADRAFPPLLVVDLNETLCCRAGRRPGDATRPALRPYLSSLLPYLFGKGEDGLPRWSVIVWSSATQKNVDRLVVALDLNTDDTRLEAVWARDKMGLTDKEYANKCQTYKNLDLLWSQVAPTRPSDPDARWDQTNTVLIDDDLIKASCQPHNLIQIPPFNPFEPLSDLTGPPSRHTRHKTSARVIDADTALLQLIGVLEDLRLESNFSAYIRTGRFESYGTPAGETVWLARGKEVCAKYAIPLIK
ncbi:uncharacterized protein L969DRAFT_93755 [Mixia osmundae IAM 14324]|uniref:FCP1 homology domain-containing protein n=1 Tax=Mixia osmundae (strain CBS 9802 / IAM 14324 / JCM 22182 / KY 12970) TaxID=764103 RepID=G7E9H2_MIXOS|nr:uncharacterized protein L969DRAFT_93755 [Mixia osmundae IAM 14324]KEI39924.1 hypothetical protein L969DRAFT_93755 [Mixia osmundae IAM 14324]GAA99291.1 hypothetical protein E5Q_05986 [Mixia osmundae IAM 14324]